MTNLENNTDLPLGGTTKSNISIKVENPSTKNQSETMSQNPLLEEEDENKNENTSDSNLSFSKDTKTTIVKKMVDNK